MEQQSPLHPLWHTSIDMDHDFSAGVKGNVQYSSNEGCGNQRDLTEECKYGLSYAGQEFPQDAVSYFDVFTCTATQKKELNNRQHQRISPHWPVDVDRWLRDEPMDIATNVGLHPFLSAALDTRDGGGSGGIEGKMEIGGGHCFSEGSSSSYCASGFSENAQTTAEQQRSSLISSMYAQLRAIKVKKSVIRDAIERHGGGQKGLQRVIRAIMFLLDARNRFDSKSSDLCISQSECLAPHVQEVDQLPWSKAVPVAGSAVDAPFDSFVDFNHVLPADLDRMMNANSTCRDDGKNLYDLRTVGSGSVEDGEVPSGQNQSHFSVLDELGSGNLRPQGAGFSQQGSSSLLPMSSGNWAPVLRNYLLRHENMNCGSMKRSPSPDGSGLHATRERAAYDDNLSHRNKIRHLSPSPAGFTSSQTSSGLLVYGSAATSSIPASEIFGTPDICGPVGANPFAPGGPFSLSLPCTLPMDPLSPDFTSFGKQGSVLIDENVGMSGSPDVWGLIDGLGSPEYPVSADNSVDIKKSRVHVGVSKSKDTPAACTRLARKKRMDRNRKATLVQANRSAETSARIAGKTGAMWSPGSFRMLSLSRGSPVFQEQSRTKHHRDQKHLQFLLQKVLRPSDVGNLSRIVLPKKDAETHLPWLGAREKMQLACQDYDTGEKMMLRYRFWPNNESRMYLLENTGDFIRRHKLQVSDAMMIYRNRRQGTYVIRARKARDPADSLSSNGPSKEMEGEEKETSGTNSPGSTCCSGASSHITDVETPESNVGSGLEGSPESVVTDLAIGTAPSQDDTLDFADLPETPMGDGAENLVRFPSLDSFHTNLLELGSVSQNKQDAKS